MKSPLVAMLLFFVACAASPPVPTVARHADAPPLPPDVPAATLGDAVARCGNTGEGFDDWIASYRLHAITTQGISRDVVEHALGRVSYAPGVIELDRAQQQDRPTFEEFVESHVTPSRVQRGKRLLATHAKLLAKITERFGVAAEIVVAIWGLETDFGANQGSTPSLRALATLAYDCRRAERFRGELLSALHILERRDLSVDEMVGAWAGELGQTQFLPSSYEHFGIDFDGDGRINLIGSTEDALGSTAHYLAKHGWHAREGYAPGSANFAVLSEWNKSEIYRKTIALFASKLAKTK